MQTMCTAKNANLRTPQSYDQHSLVATEENHVYGIKRRSILNDLNYFKLGNSLSVDIMHDILEGIAPLEIKLFINEVVTMKKISLYDLNERIRLFNYGELSQCVKPSTIVLDKPGGLIGQKAAQTWCLLRFLPLMIFDIVSDDLFPKYNIILVLLEIVSICFAPRVTISMIETLECLIEKHHKLFLSEYNLNLTPKTSLYNALSYCNKTDGSTT